MDDISTRKRALALLEQGRSLNSVSKETGVSRAAIRAWPTHLEPLPRAGKPRPRCQGAPSPPEDPQAYAHRRGVHFIRIVCDNAWPGIIDAHPWEFIRGLVHSDGWGITNWTTRLVGGETKRYEYPRYFFTNPSTDIRQLYTDTLDKVGVGWTQANAHNISVARKASVALMDTHVGPKH